MKREKKKQKGLAAKVYEQVNKERADEAEKDEKKDKKKKKKDDDVADADYEEK